MPYYQVVFKLIPVRLNFGKQIKLNPRRRSLINYFFIIGDLKTLKNPFQSVEFNSELMRYSFIVNFVKLVFIFIQKSPIISGNWERPHGNVKTKSPFIFDVLLCKLIASAPLLQYFLPRFVSCFDTTPVTTRTLCIGYRFLFLVENRSHQSLKFHKLQSWSPPTKRRSESYANAFPTISVELRCLECNR